MPYETDLVLLALVSVDEEHSESKNEDVLIYWLELIFLLLSLGIYIGSYLFTMFQFWPALQQSIE